MASITINKGGQAFTYTSLADACKQNGATSAKNKANALKYLEKIGFDVSSIATSTDTKPRATLIERIIQECKTIDKPEIDKLTSQVMELVRNLKKASDIQPIQDMQTKIEQLQNPVVSREMVLEKVGALYDAHMQIITPAPEPTKNETA